MRIPRIPRFTLFSAPTCSLCDTAKAELAKVRKSRPFELDTINIQEKGQEVWKKKYVYWIPALHLDGEEIAKGRWDAQTVMTALEEWDEAQATKLNATLPFYEQPFPGALPIEFEASGIYDRAYHEALGSDDLSDFETDSAAVFRSRCFNCGDENHTVKECGIRLDYNLIDLSRQYYKFYQELRGQVPKNWQRVHIAEGWRQTRLDWVDRFKPGQISGDLLKEALGKDGDRTWLQNMAMWGYPRGWVSDQDPRDAIRRRIWQEYGGNIEDDLDHDEPFLIFGEGGEAEAVDFAGMFEPKHAEARDGSPLESDSDISEESSAPTSLADHSMPIIVAKRWAKYPQTYFLSDLLPIHNGFSLPPIPGDRSTSLISPPPPPPTEPPPPLPPPPPACPPPPRFPDSEPFPPILHTSPPNLPPLPKGQPHHEIPNDSDDDSDMDMSD